MESTLCLLYVEAFNQLSQLLPFNSLAGNTLHTICTYLAWSQQEIHVGNSCISGADVILRLSVRTAGEQTSCYCGSSQDGPQIRVGFVVVIHGFMFVILKWDVNFGYMCPCAGASAHTCVCVCMTLCVSTTRYWSPSGCFCSEIQLFFSFLPSLSSYIKRFNRNTCILGSKAIHFKSCHHLFSVMCSSNNMSRGVAQQEPCRVELIKTKLAPKDKIHPDSQINSQDFCILIKRTQLKWFSMMFYNSN